MGSKSNSNSQKKNPVSNWYSEYPINATLTTIIAALALGLGIWQVWPKYKGTFIVTALSIPVSETRFSHDGTANQYYKYEIGVRINNKGNTPFTLINVVPFLADEITGQINKNKPLIVGDRFKQIQIKEKESEVFETFAWVSKDKLQKNSTLKIVLFPMVLRSDDKVMVAKYPLIIQVGAQSESFIAGESPAVEFEESEFNEFKIGVTYFIK